jgi:hypothetical protein
MFRLKMERRRLNPFHSALRCLYRSRSAVYKQKRPFPR